LSMRQRQVNVEIERNEEELGRYIAYCMRFIGVLTKLHRERSSIVDKQFLVSQGVSQDRAFEYQNEMQRRLSEFTFSPMYDPCCWQKPPVSSLGRKLQIIGRSFFSEPSLLLFSFHSLWHSLWPKK
jgi:hypothetical protein